MEVTGMVAAIGNALTSMLGWVGQVVDSLVGESGDLKELLVLFALGIGASLFGFAIKSIRKVTWGA